MIRNKQSFAETVAHRVADRLAPRLREVLTDIDVRLRAIEKSNRRMEIRMSEVQDVLADLNDATNAVATKVDNDTSLIAGLKQQLADALASNPQASADLDAALAGMKATADTLRGLAADQSAPVPPSDPIAGNGGDTTAGEPGTDPTSSDPGTGDVDSGADGSSDNV